MPRCFRFFYLHRKFIDALITAGMGDFLELPEDVATILYDLRKQTG